MSKRYASLYERLVANTRLAVPNDPSSCWLWIGCVGSGGYPQICIRKEEGPRNVQAHRLMLEVFHNILFPFDEAGHTCGNPLCVSPLHLEVQTRAHNMAEQRAFGVVNTDKSWIPVLFPREIEPDPPTDAPPPSSLQTNAPFNHGDDLWPACPMHSIWKTPTSAPRATRMA